MGLKDWEMVTQKVIVCGGRDFADREKVFAELDLAHAAYPIREMVQGGANGADSLARQWCAERRVACVTYEADWQSHGKKAGPLRNQLMLTVEKPDLVIAFPGGRGTADMVSRARSAGVPVRTVS